MRSAGRGVRGSVLVRCGGCFGRGCRTHAGAGPGTPRASRQICVHTDQQLAYISGCCARVVRANIVYAVGPNTMYASDAQRASNLVKFALNQAAARK